MTTPRDPDGSTRLGQTDRVSATTTGADVTGRMTGTGTELAPAKTSVAAAFALVFGLSALFCALTAILAPAAVVFGLIGLVLGIAGMRMAKRPGVTGRGVALGGLVTAVLGLLVGAAVLTGAAVVVNNENALNRIQSEVEQLQSQLPSANQVKDSVENTVQR
ncbi:MAG: DUF4190 domain-containing protein [Actinomycetota bacterium]|nr:DUF4190 domain-containing protein [Actinomycetota bacterium]